MNWKQWWKHSSLLACPFHLLSISLFGFHVLSPLHPLGFVISPHLSGYRSPASHAWFTDAVWTWRYTAVKTGAFLQEPSKSQPTFGVCLLYVKAFCKWTYCGFPDTRLPPTQLLSACREQLVNKQLDHYLAILQTWHDRVVYLNDCI